MWIEFSLYPKEESSPTIRVKVPKKFAGEIPALVREWVLEISRGCMPSRLDPASKLALEIVEKQGLLKDKKKLDSVKKFIKDQEAQIEKFKVPLEFVCTLMKQALKIKTNKEEFEKFFQRRIPKTRSGTLCISYQLLKNYTDFISGTDNEEIHIDLITSEVATTFEKSRSKKMTDEKAFARILTMTKILRQYLKGS